MQNYQIVASSSKTERLRSFATNAFCKNSDMGGFVTSPWTHRSTPQRYRWLVHAWISVRCGNPSLDPPRSKSGREPSPRAAGFLFPQPARFGNNAIFIRAEKNPHGRAADLAIVIPFAGNFRHAGRRHGKSFVAGGTNHLGVISHRCAVPRRRAFRRTADTPRYCRKSPSLFRR